MALPAVPRQARYLWTGSISRHPLSAINRSAFLRLARQLSHAITRHLYCHLIGNGILHASAFFLPFIQYPIGSGKFLLSTYSRVAHALPSSPSSVRSANSPSPSFTRLLIKLSYFSIIPSGQVNRLYLHYPFGSGNSPYLHYPLHSGAPLSHPLRGSVLWFNIPFYQESKIQYVLCCLSLWAEKRRKQQPGHIGCSVSTFRPACQCCS